MSGKELSIDENTQTISSANSASESSSNVGMEPLLQEILIARIESLKNSTGKDLEELLARQKEVEDLHKLLARINEGTDKDGKLKVTDELLEFLNKAIKSNDPNNNANSSDSLKMDPKELKILEKGKTYTSAERQRLYENIKSHIETLQTKSDMQLQALTQSTNERYETYQLARSIMKTLQELGKSFTRAVSGR